MSDHYHYIMKILNLLFVPLLILSLSVNADLKRALAYDQAGEYEKAQGKDLSDFFNSTAGKFQTKVGHTWEQEIVARRSKEGKNA